MVLGLIMQGTRAKEIGLCVDLLAVGNTYKDLASLKFVSTFSGGSISRFSDDNLELLVKVRALTPLSISNPTGAI